MKWVGPPGVADGTSYSLTTTKDTPSLHPEKDKKVLKTGNGQAQDSTVPMWRDCWTEVPLPRRTAPPNTSLVIGRNQRKKKVPVAFSGSN